MPSEMTMPPSFLQQFTQQQPAQQEASRDKLDRTHAAFTIIESLRTLNLAAWSSTLMSWLGRFDGIELHIHEDCDPLPCVRQILLGHVADKGWGGKGWQGDVMLLQARIIDDLVALDFVHHRAYWSAHPPKPRREFDPLETTWLEFMTLGQPDEDLCVWRPERGNPALSNLCRQMLLQFNQP